ncbi:MAG: hypothetical protein ACOVJ8_05255 [Sediminibacterium sp.]
MFSKKILTILSLFVVVNMIAFIGMYGDYQIGLNYYFVIVVNTMLLIMSLLNYYRLQKMDPTNANAMVRSVMLGTLLKMGVFVIAALIYATQKKGPVGITTLLVSMGIYLFYTWLEIQWATKKQ